MLLCYQKYKMSIVLARLLYVEYDHPYRSMGIYFV
jgi:hypothetical protein